MNARVVAASVALLLGACGGRTPRTVSMRMNGTPPRASVTIDDELVGTLEIVAAHGVALPPGVHRISVEAPGYLAWDRLVEAREGQGRIVLDVRLTPIPE